MTTVMLEQGLGYYERIIEDGLQTFIDVGNALLEIQSGRLYLQSNHKTFEEYCQSRWGFTRQRAHQLMGAAETVGVLSTIVDTATLPATESQVRELTKATSDPAKQAKILKNAAKDAPKDTNGKPKLTATRIKAAAKSIDPEQARIDAIKAAHRIGQPSGGTTFAPSEFDPAMAPEVQAEPKPVGVPKHLTEIAASTREFAAAMTEAGRLKGRIEKMCEAPGGGKLAKWWADIDRALTQVQTYLKCYRYWAPCPECKITDKHHKAAKDCKLCGGHGWIAKTNGLSDEHKAWLRERGIEA